ncbi:hypothetical protein BJY04DRAFT_9677 [Aspergillus karnatakaensis]|uniref:uncharacterized protein n=1 Tax=Aspergillus karnatakaensis TaxID=1810916 RepID=UPI003CCDCCC3
MPQINGAAHQTKHRFAFFWRLHKMWGIFLLILGFRSSFNRAFRFGSQCSPTAYMHCMMQVADAMEVPQHDHHRALLDEASPFKMFLRLSNIR